MSNSQTPFKSPQDLLYSLTHSTIKMSSHNAYLPTYTGRNGTLVIYAANGNVLQEVTKDITFRHAEVHHKTIQGQASGIYDRAIISNMHDGGPVPTPFDFVEGLYMGTLDQNGRVWFGGMEGQMYQPYVAMHGMQPIQLQYPQAGNVGSIGANSGMVVEQQQPQIRPVEGQMANSPIVIEDDNASRIPVPAPKEPSPEPAPPCYLKERMVHLKAYVRASLTTRQAEMKWLESIRMASKNQQRQYCRLFWPSNEQAEEDVTWAAKHFNGFSEANVERLAIEGKKKDGLVWEKDGQKIEAKWLEKMKARKTAKSSQQIVAKKRREEQDAKREARLAELAEKKSNREEEKKRKAEEKKARREAEKRAAAEERKRKAAPASEAPSKKRKIDAQLPTPDATDVEEMGVNDGLGAAIEAGLLEAFDDDDGLEADSSAQVADEEMDDGLLNLAMEYLESREATAPEEDLDEESDADDDEAEAQLRIGTSVDSAIRKAQQEELASKPQNQANTPQEQLTPAPTSTAQESDNESDPNFQVVTGEVSEGEEESEEEAQRDHDIDSLFDMEADQSSEEESDDEEVEEQRPHKILSEKEIERQKLDADIEELKGSCDRSTNQLMKKKYQQMINKLRDARLKLM
ncbi:hypothetical protein SLS60_011084 [Paraconiothyrium brasiliense]|uniref:Uncharacterized protein n=1 Tax=Paraconiothyrium brasiliense TaxID=300254 RepID=A0ABR3QL39_9PLEO